ncbi:MAG TPA: CocE/NonD family hydrolase [Gemmatales bacterium]|nr:CocE/NonD family hydrolase [Gemmatales bacterium]
MSSHLYILLDHLTGKAMKYCLAILLASSPLLFGQEIQSVSYERKTVNVAMRDGIQLHTVIHTPKDQKTALPILLQRTPYGADNRSPLQPYLRDMAEDGYIFVFQDIRGRFQSEGTFEMIRPGRDKNIKNSIDESTDAYDTIDWLIKNIPNNNGRVGILGISYDGWLSTMALVEPHPSLKACSPQAPVADMFLGDDFHHNGAFRLSYGFEYVALMETNNRTSSFKFDKVDTYEWYLKLGPLSNVNAKHFHGKMPTWNRFTKHPNYDDFWKNQSVVKYIQETKVPTLNVAGWWDQEDFYGPLTTYSALEKHDNQSINFKVIGPWNHGGWANSNGDSLGNIKFHLPTAKFFREKVQAPFFAKYLKDKPGFDIDEVLTFQTGSNRWQKHNQWPPREAVASKLYFHEDGQLRFEAPSAASGHDTYISDPNKPVPYRLRPIFPTYSPGSNWNIWLVSDQRFVHNRPDVLTYETTTLEDDVTLTGTVKAKLHASTTGTDSDWVVKLIDVYPDDYAERAMAGYQLMVANDVFRGRFRESFESPKALEPGRVLDYNINLHSINHTFKKGHKIMVQVQSTWFPLIDRNPQTFVPNIFEANISDFQVATQTVHRNRHAASCLEVYLVK